jgi:hypothetical protein
MYIKCTPNFKKKLFTTSSPDMLMREIAALKSFIDRKRNNEVQSWPENLQPVVGLSKKWPALREWRISSKGRIIFTESSSPVLVDFELGHTSLESIQANWTASNLNNQVSEAESLNIPDQETNAIDLLEIQEGNYGEPIYVEEFFNSWVYFLDAQQNFVKDQIEQEILNQNGNQLLLLLAGAGTGKTSILVNLAFSLETNNLQAALKVNPGVKSFLNSSGRNIPSLKKGQNDPSVSVVLVDDPLTLASMTKSIHEATALGKKIVVAVDPTQWHQRRLAESWKKFLDSYNFKVFDLDVVYRQSEGVGKPISTFLSGFFNNSSAFVDPLKVRDERQIMQPMWKLCLNDLKYMNPEGGFRFFGSEWNPESLIVEVERTTKLSSDKKWPPLLVGHDPDSNLESLFFKHIPSLSAKNGSAHRRLFSDTENVRGTEYDFVILFITQDKWKLLSRGKNGLTKSEWESLNTTLTFMTRAKFHVSVYLTDGIPGMID